ncbi:NAD/NADP octopine/nopaline dehydrogenase family protein [Candidatus Bathyarchaeota archaeon]|nr:NAD/NADP octopine/nopaline dehydrogenase family protein [Candidatus Bathyarchaeota archaeon]
MTRVAVLGAGAGGCAVAHRFAEEGFRVSLYDVDEERIRGIRERGGVEARGEIEGFQEVEAYAKLSEALRAVDFAVAVVPRYAHQSLAEALAPHLKGRPIILLPESTFGALHVAKTLREGGERRSAVGGTPTLPYAARLIEPGLVDVHLIVKILLFAAFPASRIDELLELLEGVYSQVVRAENILETSLNNGNPVTHPAPALLNAARIEAGEDFLFYREGITPSIARINQRVDEERLSLCRVLGLREIGVVERLRMLGYIDFETDNLYEAYVRSKPFSRIKAPKTLQHRYITEDIPYGLVSYASLGDLLDVETPTMDTLIDLASLLMDVNYWAEGVTMRKLGLKGLTVEELREFVEVGASPKVEWARG